MIKKPLPSLLMLVVLALDVAALWQTFDQPPSGMHGYWLLIFHVFASALCAALVYFALPTRCQQPKRSVLCLLFLLALFIPLFGAFGMWIAMQMVERWPGEEEADHFRALAVPEFTPQGDHIQIRFGAGGVRARLADHNASAESRLEALLAIKAMPQRLSSDILRNMLDDPEEDLRLLAYGMLDNEEKNINKKINSALEAYQKANGTNSELSRRLASLYWELVYHNLAQGDVRQYALQQAVHYAQEALQSEPDEAGIYVLLGKIYAASDDLDAAEQAMQQAQALGYPMARLTPYLAEQAYRAGQYARVAELIKTMKPLGIGDLMQPVTQFWSKKT